MQANKARLIHTIIFLMLVAASSCDVGSTLFTEEELDLMYEVGLSQDGLPLVSGFRATLEKPLEISISVIDGAPEPASMDINLSDANGLEVAAITFVTEAEDQGTDLPLGVPGTDTPAVVNPAEASARDTIPEVEGTPANSVVVEDLLRDIPPFTVPEGLPDGYYVMSVSVKDDTGTVLSAYSTVLLFFEGYLASPSLAIYPGTVLPGRVSLLKLAAAFPENLDPWIRWSIQGKVTAFGPVSEMMDRLAWEAPMESGIYLAKAEVFPFKPPVGFDLPPASTASIRLPVSTGAIPVDVLETMPAWSRFAFEGNLNDSGSRPRTTEPGSIGSPYPETYASGYGYRLGNGSGLFSPSTLIPAGNPEGGIPDFTVVFVTAPIPDKPGSKNGYLLTFATRDGSDRLVLGVENGYPYVASKASRIASQVPLPANLSRLAIYISPTATNASVSFYIDDKPAGSGTLPTGFFNALPGSCTIAGGSGYDAVYDEIIILEGSYPSFWLSETNRLGPALLAASGFEGGVTGSGMETAESATTGNGFLNLPEEASLVVGEMDKPFESSTLSFDLLAGNVTIRLKLDDDTTLSIDTDGAVSIDDLKLLPILQVHTDTKHTVSIEATEGKIKIYGIGEEYVDLQALPAADARWILLQSGEVSARVTNVSLSTFEPPVPEGFDSDQDETDSTAINMLLGSLIARQ